MRKERAIHHDELEQVEARQANIIARKDASILRLKCQTQDDNIAKEEAVAQLHDQVLAHPDEIVCRKVEHKADLRAMRRENSATMVAKQKEMDNLVDEQLEFAASYSSTLEDYDTVAKEINSVPGKMNRLTDMAQRRLLDL